MTSLPMTGIKVSAEVLDRLITSFGNNAVYGLHAVMPLSKQCVYRVRLETRFDEFELPIVDSPISISFQRASKSRAGADPKADATLSPDDAGTEVRPCTLLQIRSNGNTVDLHLEPDITLPDDGGPPWVLILDVHDPPGVAFAKPSDTRL